MADVPIPDIGSFIWAFIAVIEKAIHDILTLSIDSAQPLITILLLATAITLIGGTLLTVMYIILASLGENRRMRI